MNKYLLCPICGKSVRAKNKKALVRLCKKHRTKEYINKLRRMTIEEIIAIKDSFAKIKFQEKQIKTTNKEVEVTPKKLEPKIKIENNMAVNEFGEPLT